MRDARPSPRPTEAELIARLRRRDTDALELLMERHAARVYRVALGITRSDADAEEVVQDVYRVATNAALARRRGKRLELEVSLEDQLPTFKEDGHRTGERSFLLADWAASAEEGLVSGETHAMVRRAIDPLPPHYRAVVVLRDIEELSNEEAAEVLGEPVSAIKSRLHRARIALREQLTRLMTTDKREVSDEEDDSFIVLGVPHDEPGDGSAA